jgi:hypothetical protein
MHTESNISISDKIISGSALVQENQIETIREQLIPLINELINTDFQALIQLLYRIDVNGKTVKDYLNKNTNKDAAPLIAGLIIERQLQKMKSRKYFTRKQNEKSGEEEW